MDYELLCMDQLSEFSLGKLIDIKTSTNCHFSSETL